MLYLSNTLPGFVKMLIDFHDDYRRKCKNIYPCCQVPGLCQRLALDFTVWEDEKEPPSKLKIDEYTRGLDLDIET